MVTWLVPNFLAGAVGSVKETYTTDSLFRLLLRIRLQDSIAYYVGLPNISGHLVIHVSNHARVGH